MRQTLLVLTIAALTAAAAEAQPLTLTFSEGRVSVTATSVPVRTILTEWAKLGGTKVVGAERISGPPLTLTLEEVPEAQALDIILRSVAGYMVAPRGAGTGASIYDRILILATSSGPAPAAPRPAVSRPGSTAGTQRFIPPAMRNRTADPAEQAEQPEPDEMEEAEEDPDPPNPPVFTFPQPGQQPGAGGPPIITVNPATGAPQSITINPSDPPSEEATTPFGTTGASAPGMIARPPAPPTPPRPGPMVRPPGDR